MLVLNPTPIRRDLRATVTGARQPFLRPQSSESGDRTAANNTFLSITASSEQFSRKIHLGDAWPGISIFWLANMSSLVSFSVNPPSQRGIPAQGSGVPYRK